MLSFSNPLSLSVQRHLETATARLQRSFERLSSGLRIVQASDDPAGLVMSERLRAQIAALGAVEQNLERGLALVRTAGGYLGEVQDLVIRLRELATLAANDTLAAADRTVLQQEFAGLAGEVQRIVQQGRFDGVPLFTTSAALRLQVGLDPRDVLSIPRADLRAPAAGLTRADITTAAGVTAAVNALDSFQGNLTALQGTVGTTDRRLSSLLATAGTLGLNLSAAESRIRDVDVAAETAELAKNQILQAAGVALLAQANLQPEVLLRLFEFSGA